jgi:hypothetical protein
MLVVLLRVFTSSMLHSVLELTCANGLSRISNSIQNETTVLISKDQLVAVIKRLLRHRTVQ